MEEFKTCLIFERQPGLRICARGRPHDDRQYTRISLEVRRAREPDQRSLRAPGIDPDQFRKIKRC